MGCPAIGTEHECPKIGTESECVINDQLCSSTTNQDEIPLKEVDIYLQGEIRHRSQTDRLRGRVQRTQTHTFAVGDKYELLPEDEDPDVDDWTINDIIGHPKNPNPPSTPRNSFLNANRDSLCRVRPEPSALFR